MPLYFFDVCDERGSIPDEEGTECFDLGAAVEEAKACGRDLAKQMIDEHRSVMSCRIEIRDRAGWIMAFVPISAILSKPH